MATPNIDFLLRMGDTALILSQRLGEWCGKGPALEEDMALTNVALDLLGQARLWLGYAAQVQGQGADEDHLAFHRDAHEFRNALLVEQPNGSYADTVMRQFLFDAWHALVLRELSRSADAHVADIAQKAAKEVAYHLRRSTDLAIRLGDGTARSQRLMQDALDALWRFTGDLFDLDALHAGLDACALHAEWLAYVDEVCTRATLRRPPADAWMQRGSRRGVHTEHLSRVLAEMQVLPRSHPGASW